MRFLSALLFAFYALPSVLAGIVVKVNGTASHAIPPTLYGHMFEDIGHSGDGGLYAEILQNRAFQQVKPNTTAALYAWGPVGAADISVVAAAHPVSSALPNSLQLVIPSDASGHVGFGNAGYAGINVNSSWTYNASFYYKVTKAPTASTSTLNMKASLVSFTTNTILGFVPLTLSASQTNWTQVKFQLRPTTSGPDVMNNFTLTFDQNARGSTIEFAMFSLFPPTFKGRQNGMRIDLAQALADTKPSFFRFPGGNNIEGQTVATRWQWNATVGPLVDRPGRMGDWGYINTDGLGLLEYLLWCEDLNMVPIMGVYDGYSLGPDVVSEGELDSYIQQAIDQINFVIGDPSESAAAALRASLGYPQPFKLSYVEIGNEDFINTSASSSAPYRWRDFYGNLSAAFPQLRYIATPLPFNPILTPTPQYYDVHKYDTPQWFASNSFYYDDFERNGTQYFEGEYASQGIQFPDMESAASEAAFMTGFERNADIVFAAAFAPTLQRADIGDGHINLVDFDVRSLTRTTSYYVQQMFSLNAGDEYLPSTLPNKTGELFWSVTRRTSSNETLFKIANTNATDLQVSFNLPFSTIAPTATATVLAGAASASNTPEEPSNVTPKISSFDVNVEQMVINFTAPAWSVSILNVVAH